MYSINRMKYFQRAAWLILAIQIIMLVLELGAFQIEDMTLSKGTQDAFDDGWVMMREDGTREDLHTLPYIGKSKAGETVVLENTIPQEYKGQTLYFLSADKQLRVWIDDREVYEFGMTDKRLFGHTPGSIVNFIDIPADMKQGNIRIEMVSPYADYAAVVTKMTIADRDIAIMGLLKSNLLNIVFCVLILISAIILILLAVVEKISGQGTQGLVYLSLYCLDAAFYYFIETKILSIFYGNQTLYSMLVFMCLMLMPLFLMLYYERSRMGEYNRRYQLLLMVICANIFIQLILQAFDIFDFMEMVSVSHVLVFLTSVFIVASFLEASKKTNGVRLRLEIFALFCMIAGSIMDIIRSYLFKVGDMGKYGRMATAIFSITMVIVHIVALSKNYASSVEERAAAKGRFLAHMSHEIRTPIHAVLGMDEMILRESGEPFIREYAADIYSAGQTLLSLVNDILDFSKIESGKMELVMADYDLCSVIHDLVNMIFMRAQEKGLEFSVSVEADLPSGLRGDDVRLRQILSNLLTNAVKYTNEGSVHLSVSGVRDAEDVILHFEVVDTGIGIKKEDIPKLFEEFERIEEKRNRSIEGTGLGMNITTQLLHMMGSRLCVESVYAKGSKFSFDLRQQVVNENVVGNFKERVEQIRDHVHEAGFYAPDAKVLIVDDNEINRKVIHNLLKQNRVQVFEAESGQECLDMVRQQSFDLIFLDHMMLEMDGVETLHRMRNTDDYPCKYTPVIVLTANAVAGAKENYLKEGFDDFLSKPVIPGKLENMIFTWLPEELLQDTLPEEDISWEEELGRSELEDLPVVDGIDWNYTWLHLSDMELLEYTVGEFYLMIEESAEELENLYQKIDEDDGLAAYRVKAHGMKSSAALIGAVPLAGMAKILEFAAKEHNVEKIRTLTPAFLEEWRSYKNKLKNFVILKEEERTGR